MSDDNLSDYDDEPIVSPTFPKLVKTAGYIWIVFGSLILLSALVSFAIETATKADDPKNNPVGGVCSLIISVLFGAVFFHVGKQSISGEAKDTLGNSIGSIIFSLIYSGIGVMSVVAGLAMGGGAAGPIILGLVMAVCSLGLLVAGVMALMGRTQYKAWKKDQRAKNPKTKKRKKVDRDEEEEE
ncbi:hypothetical protein [Zavarzinella formosa]|uniref:hypothetical protein n=1 Tax=Zavarzinella formosa TaxID=360055 RepID=UPI0002E52E72|nr:hypothetical protein [Zavarzinella formosa]